METGAVGESLRPLLRCCLSNALRPCLRSPLSQSYELPRVEGVGVRRVLPDLPYPSALTTFVFATP
jgi:hypothetical protein